MEEQNNTALEMENARSLMPKMQTLEKSRIEIQARLENKSEELRSAILKCSPKVLIGALWMQLFMNVAAAQEKGESPADVSHDYMYALEYVHAVLSSHSVDVHGDSSDVDSFPDIFQLAIELRDESVSYALLVANEMPEMLPESIDGELALQAMLSWITLRGHRYQPLEAEFFEFVLHAHNDALLEVYGVSAQEIAIGIQAAVDATRFGLVRAMETLHSEIGVASPQEVESALTIDELTTDPNEVSIGPASEAISDLLLGGICNVSKTSKLPPKLLSDLAYVPGEEAEFFSEGPLKGTFLRRLPGRIKPLVMLDGDYYLCDANFIRDSTYRSIQWGLLDRLPKYKDEWEKNQAHLTEEAFPEIFKDQLRRADVIRSFYYPDPDTGKWVENDLLILIDDVMLQIEVKAGVMPKHSPDLYFDRHVRTIQNLVIKAYGQCNRFFRYAATLDAAPIFEKTADGFKEIKKIRLSDYRRIFPIGLTVEAFSPFSAMSKRLDEIAPILGKYPFVSMSIDDLFVLSRFLPTTGALMHYFEVRQSVAGIRGAAVFDEVDHLGGYIQRGRLDFFYRELLKDNDLIVDPHAAEPVNKYCSGDDLDNKPPPSQEFPKIVLSLLGAIDRAHVSGYLQADATIRDMSFEVRKDFARALERLIPTLKQHPARSFSWKFEEPLLVWIQRTDYWAGTALFRERAEEIALSFGARVCNVLVVHVAMNGDFARGWMERIHAPETGAAKYEERLAAAEKTRQRVVALTPQGQEWVKRHGG